MAPSKKQSGHVVTPHLSRRAFIVGSAAALGSLTVACSDTRVDPGGLHNSLPEPALSGIEHVILVMMENRSFDHFMGWLPGADGQQASLVYRNAAGLARETFPLAPDFRGCGYVDPDHTYTGGRVQYNGGACDGWLRASDLFSIGYYRREDLSFLGQAAPDWMSFDRYFSAIMASTDPNRIYQHAAQTDRLANSSALCALPTIWDRLESAGIQGRYYFRDYPVLNRWGTKYQPIMSSLDSFFVDCGAGTLPSVAFVDPPRIGPDAQDDHPFADVRAGEVFLNQVYTAVTTGPLWPHTVLIINYDEWGGFFDHVAPPAAPIPDADRLAGNADGLRGFRTPMLVISPFARRAYTSHVVYDHTSVLALIEWRWGLQPLTVRDATANNPALEFEFTDVHFAAPLYMVPSVTTPACPTSAASV